MRIEYDYSRNNYSGSGRTFNSGNISRHHTIAYPHMYEYGVILLAYFQTLGDALDKDPCFLRFLEYYRGQNAVNYATIHRILEEHVREQYGVINYRENKCRNFFMTVAWTEANLFTGPAGKLRGKDPGQGQDEVPVSSETSAFIRKLKELRASGIEGEIAMNQGENGWLNLSEDKISGIARQYIEALPNFSRSFETRVSDWRAVLFGEAEGNRSYDCFDIFFSKNSKNGKFAQYEFQLELAENPAFISADKQRQRLRKDKIVVLTGIGHTGNRDFFTGVLKNKESDFLAQANQTVVDQILIIES